MFSKHYINFVESASSTLLNNALLFRSRDVLGEIEQIPDLAGTQDFVQNPYRGSAPGPHWETRAPGPLACPIPVVKSWVRHWAYLKLRQETKSGQPAEVNVW